MEKNSRFFTSEGYKRLERNPFVDKEMLRFIRGKRRQGAFSLKGDGGMQGGGSGKTVHLPEGGRQSLTEKNIRIMAGAIKTMLHE